MWLLIGLYPVFGFAQPRHQSDADFPGLHVEAEAGLGGFLDVHRPIPVSFLLRNDSGRDIEGVLTLTGGMFASEINLGEVVVSPGSTRRLTTIQSTEDWSDCSATLTRGSRVLWRRMLDLNTGHVFEKESSHVLFIDANGRNFDLPPIGIKVDSQHDHAGRRISGPRGRHVRSLTAKPWQLPNHPGPLLGVQIIVFPDGLADRDLNMAQWNAIAQWVCEGGILYVHKSAPEIVKRLLQIAPLNADFVDQSNSNSMRRVGLGAIVEFDRSVMTGDSSEIRNEIAETASRLSHNQIYSFDDLTVIPNMKIRQADQNRNTIIGLFVVYAILVSGGGFFLCRCSQKVIAGYTISVVLLASVVAAGLGRYLSVCPGELRWETLTEVGIGGAVQTARIEVQSTGNRSTSVAVKGPAADLQYVGIAHHPYSYYPASCGYSPFTWQPNRAAGESDICQITVPMSPWGRRRCHATAFQRGYQPLDIELSFLPSDPDNHQQMRINGAMPAGKFSLKVKNRLPFDLKDCSLVVSTTNLVTLIPGQAQQQSQGSPYKVARQPGFNPDDERLKEHYHIHDFSLLAPGETYEQSFSTSFQLAHDFRWKFGRFASFHISRHGSASAWIFARVAKSPILEIDESRSDFVAEEGTHYLVQQIELDHLSGSLMIPDLETLLKASSDAKPPE